MDNFEKLRMMSERNMDIKLATLNNISEINIDHADGFVTFGVPASVAKDLMLHPERFVGGLIIADKEQFESIETKSNDAGEQSRQADRA